MARTRLTPQPASGALGNGKKRRGIGNRVSHGPRAADDAAAFARRERREKVGTLRVRHSLDFPEIGRELGISTSQAHRDYHQWLDEQPPSPLAPVVRREEEPKLQRNAQRVEALIASTLKRALDDSKDERGRPVVSTEEKVQLTALAAKLSREATRLSESRRALHGADAPVKRELSGPGGGPVPVASAKVNLGELLALGDENEGVPK